MSKIKNIQKSFSNGYMASKLIFQNNHFCIFLHLSVLDCPLRFCLVNDSSVFLDFCALSLNNWLKYVRVTLKVCSMNAVNALNAYVCKGLSAIAQVSIFEVNITYV